MKIKMNDMSSEEVDRISSLPDDVLHHIFSFLNTKHTVQTSVLSKRWRYFWTSLPFLNFIFDPRGYYWLSKKLRSFQRFVTSVFFFRNDSNLQRLTFSCKSSVESSFLNMVIHYAVSHNVQELTIKACADRSFEWPPCLLTCQSLKTLHVDAFYGSKGSGMEIIANCPNLENLVLVNITDFNISAPKLRNLEILSDPNPYQADAKIVVSTPKLTSFKYEGCNPLLGSLEDLSCLEKVHIALLPGFPYCDLQDEEKLAIALNLFTTLSVLRNAKSLTLSLVAIKLLSSFPSLLQRVAFVLCNLRPLKLKKERKRTTINMLTHVMVYLHKISPFVETMVMEFPKANDGTVSWIIERGQKKENGGD